MRELYKNWLKYTEKENEEIWENAIITFDTNVLMGLYRISPKLSALFFELTSKVENRIFLTYHAGWEFHKNRYNAIGENISLLSNLNKQINDFEIKIKNHTIFNYISEDTKKQINIDLNQKKAKVKSRKDYYTKLESNDKIYSKLNLLFKNKIENQLNEKEKEEIFKSGKIRYEKKIPPGYSDYNKQNGNKFGDLLIWNEILRKAKVEKKDVILVTNEKKEDWIWSVKNKKIIGTRPELKEEFFKECGNRFTITNLENYLLSIAKITGTDTKKANVKKEFKLEALFERNHLKIINPNESLTKVSNDTTQLQEERNEIKQVIETLKSKEKLDEAENILVKNLTLRLNIIDENLNKIYSRRNDK